MLYFNRDFLVPLRFKGGQTLEQFVHSGYVVCISGNIQNPTRCCSGQHVLADPAWFLPT